MVGQFSEYQIHSQIVVLIPFGYGFILAKHLS